MCEEAWPASELAGDLDDCDAHRGNPNQKMRLMSIDFSMYVHQQALYFSQQLT